MKAYTEKRISFAHSTQVALILDKLGCGSENQIAENFVFACLALILDKLGCGSDKQIAENFVFARLALILDKSGCGSDKQIAENFVFALFFARLALILSSKRKK